MFITNLQKTRVIWNRLRLIYLKPLKSGTLINLQLLKMPTIVRRMDFNKITIKLIGAKSHETNLDKTENVKDSSRWKHTIY